MSVQKWVRVCAWAALFTLSNAYAADRPLKVYILAGQSNMQGQAKTTTLVGMASDDVSKPLYDKIVDESGQPRVYKDVYVAAFSGRAEEVTEKHGPLTIGFGSDLTNPDIVGPELAFGITLYEQVREPILIIKTSWGGKSLNTDFRPPSAGPYPFSEESIADLKKKGTYEKVLAAKEKATGYYYRLMLKHVQTVLADPGKYCQAYDPTRGYEIAGFVWFQGWNDMVDGGTYPGKDYKLYGELLAGFIRDVRKDFKAPQMPFVIGVMGTGGKPDRPDPFREAMAAPAALSEFKGNVVAVHTARYYDEKLGELEDRGWRWMRPQYDPENKYRELAEKLLPLQKEMNETKNIEDRNRRNQRVSELKDQMTNIQYTREELEYIKNNRSNKGFHYQGSAKMYSRFGEAFARALIELEQK